MTGSRKDAIDSLRPAAQGKVKAAVNVVPMNKLQHVFEEMKSGKLHGRVVLDLHMLE